jgi:hypothetical protein
MPTTTSIAEDFMINPSLAIFQPQNTNDTSFTDLHDRNRASKKLSDKSQGQGHLALVEIQVPIWTLQRDISEV